MKLNFTSLTLVAALFAGTAMAQSTKQFDESNSYLDRFENLKKSTSDQKAVEGNLVAADGYLADATLDIPFVFTLTNEDGEWVDSLSITFPDGFTINSVSNDDVFFAFDNPNFDDEAFNGIDGSTITWGDNDNSFGGIASPGPTSDGVYTFSVNVTVDAGLSGDQSGVFFASGDQFGANPADLSGTFTIPDGPQVSVYDIIENSDDHTTLEAALIAAELDGALSDLSADLTVFAPTDAAFAAIQSVVDELLLDPSGALVNVLLYHVVAGTALSGDLTDGQEVLTLHGESVTISIDGNVVSINDAEVTVADLIADNGVVHVIDAVLVPNSCVIANNPAIQDAFASFGGAPVAEDGVCPFNLFDGYQVWAGEIYGLDNCVEGTTYTFGLSGGSTGAWPATFVVVEVATGIVVASGVEDNSITWTCPADGSYNIIIQEEGTCGTQSENTGTDGGFPYTTCEDPLSSNDFVAFNNLSVYPNPSNSQFTVELELDATNDVTIDIVNIVGQVVKSVDLGTRSVGLNREYIDVNDLSEGIYFMNLTVGATHGTVKVQVVR